MQRYEHMNEADKTLKTMGKWNWDEKQSWQEASRGQQKASAKGRSAWMIIFKPYIVAARVCVLHGDCNEIRTLNLSINHMNQTDFEIT